MPGMSNAVSLSFTSVSGCLPSFICTASATSSSSGGLNAGSRLNISPKRASRSRPERTAMSLPRGLPTAWFARTARGLAGTRGGGVRDGRGVRGAACAIPVPPTKGSAATPARPASTDRRETWRFPVVAGAPLNGQVPPAPGSVPCICGPRPSRDRRRLPSGRRLPERGSGGQLRKWGPKAPIAGGLLTRSNSAGTVRSERVLPIRPARPLLPVASLRVLHRGRLVTGEDLVQPVECVVVQLDVERVQRALQVAHRARPDDRCGHRGLVQQPREADVGRTLAEVAAQPLVLLERRAV